MPLETLDLLGDLSTVISRLNEQGRAVFFREAQAPAQQVNVLDSGSAEVFAQLGGAMIITRVGGDAFVLQDRDDNFYCRVAGAPGVKIMHPSLSQAIPLADMRSYMGFIPAIYTRE